MGNKKALSKNYMNLNQMIVPSPKGSPRLHPNLGSNNMDLQMETGLGFKNIEV